MVSYAIKTTEENPFPMHQSSFEYVPQGDISSFTSQQPLQNVVPVAPPDVPPTRPIEQIASQLHFDAPVQDVPSQTPSSEEKKKRLYVPASTRQREILIEEDSNMA